MTVESVTYISDLDPGNPSGGDSISQGDNHLRILKSSIKETFPEIKGKVTVSHDQINELPNLIAKKSGVFASCRYENGTMLYGHNVSGIDPIQGTAGYKVTFTQPVVGFDQNFAVLCQPYATNGKHVVLTVTSQTNNSVDFTALEFDFPSQTWQTPESAVGFSLVMVDMAQV